MRWFMAADLDKELRLECLRLAVEFGTQRDISQPHLLAEMYYKWVPQGSHKGPDDSKKEGSRKETKNLRVVRKGSKPQIV